jgi:hypothetical protein
MVGKKKKKKKKLNIGPHKIAKIGILGNRLCCLILELDIIPPF